MQSLLEIKDLITVYLIEENNTMKIIQNEKDGSAEIRFSWKEIFIIIRKRKLVFTAEGLRDFGNNLVRIVSEWNANFNDKIKARHTQTDEIESKYK